MEDEILEFNYKNPNRSSHPRGCTCVICHKQNRGFGPRDRILNTNTRLGISSRGVGEGKTKITIPKVNLPTLVFNGEKVVKLDVPPDQKEAHGFRSPSTRKRNK